jgi:Ca-activated chloride channel family protein
MMHARRYLLLPFILCLPLACGGPAKRSPTGGSAVATVRVIRAEVTATAAGGASALVGSEQRLNAGTRVSTRSGRAWVEHDAGIRALLGEGSTVRLTEGGLAVEKGVAWVEAPEGPAAELLAGTVAISASHAGLEVRVPAAGPADLYVARGRAEVRLPDRLVLVRAGLRATLTGKDVKLVPEALWDDWTGGLAWPAPDVPSAPAGMGAIGARTPGSEGEATFPLAVRRLEVKARIDRDLVMTTVDQTFFNPASEDLEGVYRVRVPEGATLHAFCIDREVHGLPKLTCGYVKEKQMARTDYQAQVYVGSTDDPALLEWEAPGRYQARIYPIPAGASRRVVILYSEWLRRDPSARRWAYPMGGAGSAAPLIQEFSLEVDVGESGATAVEAGMGALTEGSRVVLHRSDFQPRADFVLALRGGDQTRPAMAYSSAEMTKEEGRYLMLRLRPEELERSGARTPLDLVIVVDTSAETDPTELQLSRTVVDSLLRHLGPGDRVAVVGADLGLHQPGGGKVALTEVTPAATEKLLENLAREGVGGATDLGAVLTDAAGLLQGGRGGAVVYVGDGLPTVGELQAEPLLLRLNRLPVPVRLYGVAIGPESNLALLDTLAERQGGLALRVTDRAQAGAAALQLVAHANRPIMAKVKVELGPRAERVFPADPVCAVAGQELEILARLRGLPPESVIVTGWYQGQEVRHQYAVKTTQLKDQGELRRRWAAARLRQLIASGAGREEVAELGTRFGLITEHTSIYVPSAREMTESDEHRKQVEAAGKVLQAELDRRQARAREMKNEKRKGGGKAATRSVSKSAPAEAADKKLQEAELKEESRDAMSDEMSADRPASMSAPEPRASDDERSADTTARSARPRAALEGFRADFQAAPPPAPGSPPRTTGAGATGRVHSGEGFGLGGGGGGAGIGRGKDNGLRRPARMKLKADAAAAPPDAAAKLTPPARGYKRGGFGGESSGHSPGMLSTLSGMTDGLGRLADDEDQAKAKQHVPKHCSPASQQALELRVLLWKERLRKRGAAEVWLDALRHCEARSWRERRTLLGHILNSMGSIEAMARFATGQRRWLGYGELAYLKRAIFARIRNANDLRVANAAFYPGGGSDWAEVLTLLARQKTEAEKIREVLALLVAYPRDVRLKLFALDLLKGAKRYAEAERLCEEVSGNPYADAQLRSAAGEYWARRGQTERAKRLFSEIVEFRPTDPLARRRLGDLYRAFGWYEEAYRQYVTLAALTPADSSVLLLMALAAAGAGRVDEALRLEERVAQSAAGSGGAARWALLWTTVRLAQLRADARTRKDDKQLMELLGRTRRSGVLANARPVRAILTWSHPEADLELWGAHPGWRPQRADELAPQFGIEAFGVRKVEKGTYTFEVRRVGRLKQRTLEAQLLVLWDEGETTEHLQVIPLSFKPETRTVRVTAAERRAQVVP